MKSLFIVSAMALSLAACSTAEKTATGAGVGAVVVGAATSSVGGAVVGAFIGGFGTYLATTANGNCQYRRRDGSIYTRKCHYRR